tara:strand:+ start:144 stop:308 length:165 start_codon:yes stop_codon:yes gene_type:complete
MLYADRTLPRTVGQLFAAREKNSEFLLKGILQGSIKMMREPVHQLPLKVLMSTI